ncbi:carboxyl transferase domain-containing protein [Sulfitobacter porphyrae]|uniref:Carboxyl transferase domain-containing protein n=1 Tax=Sulfitobacter porphyrae TaxID=1246864 RepID=A0ABW2BBW5_9RHOB
MRRIESLIDTNAADYKANYAAMSERLKEFHARQHAARFERPQRDIDRLERQNKLGVRERLKLLLDPGTPFLEFSTLAACREYDGTVPGAAVVTGIGIVQGREVAIHANDASVKGGAWYPHTVKKVVRLLDVALENRLPVVHICDSAAVSCRCNMASFPTAIWAGGCFATRSS